MLLYYIIHYSYKVLRIMLYSTKYKLLYKQRTTPARIVSLACGVVINIYGIVLCCTVMARESVSISIPWYYYHGYGVL